MKLYMWARRADHGGPLAVDALPPSVLVAFAAVAGACVGSFLNVVIARVPHGRSIVRPGSACPRCGAPIRWYDNVPVLSFLWLRARCRACRAPISIRYPLVELLAAGAGALAVWRHGASPQALVEFAVVSLLVALALIDLDLWLLPHALTLPLAALGLASSALGVSPAGSLAPAALGAVLGAGFFWIVSAVGSRLAKRDAMGFGDVVLLGALGAYLGVRALVPLVLLSSLQGAIVGVALLALGRVPRGPGDAPPEAPGAARDGEADGERWVPPRHSLPFGPFLALAALEWLYLGGHIVSWIPALEPFL
jgi:leader peptidase (prepilin peptidase) / N-methyltransferase